MMTARHVVLDSDLCPNTTWLLIVTPHAVSIKGSPSLCLLNFPTCAPPVRGAAEGHKLVVSINFREKIRAIEFESYKYPFVPRDVDPRALHFFYPLPGPFHTALLGGKRCRQITRWTDVCLWPMMRPGA
eukprot:6277840-Prymnesium_polylepis.3